MSAAVLLATSKTEATQPDLRRITEDDPDYQQLHSVTVARLQRSVRQYAREVRRGDPGADTRFINRHIALMRQAYEAAHHAGQKDYWPAVSQRTVQHRYIAADPDQANKRLAYYALGSVLKMAHEVKAYQRAQQVATLDESPESPESITLAAPTDVPSNFDNRVVLQGQIVWSGLQDGYAAAGASDSASPYAQLYWNLGDAKQHCMDCPDLAFGSPYDPPWSGAGSNQLTQSPGDGQTECGAACKCSLSYDYPSGDALSYLNQAIADRWTQFMAEDSPLPALTTGAQPAQKTVFTPLQRGLLDEYRNAHDAWDEARGSLPAAPGMFNGSDWTGAKLTPWGAMTPYQRDILARMEQAQIDWLHAVGQLNWPVPKYTPDQETAIMKWLRDVQKSKRWVTPPYIPSPEEQNMQWLADVAKANLWPEPPIAAGDDESKLMAWLAEVEKSMQWPPNVDYGMSYQEALESIKLYNPNHDGRGRFTYGSGATTTVARGQGRTVRQGGRRVQNNQQQQQQAPSPAATSAGSGGGSSSGSSAASSATHAERLAQAQTRLQEAQAHLSAARQEEISATNDARAKADVLQNEQTKLQNIEGQLKGQAREQIIAESATRAPATYAKYQQAQQTANATQKQMDAIDIYGARGPFATQREIRDQVNTQYEAEHNGQRITKYRQYNQALRSSGRYDEYQQAQAKIGEYNRLSTQNYNAKKSADRLGNQLVGNRLGNTPLVYQHPDYLAQKAVVDAARTDLTAAQARYASANAAWRSADTAMTAAQTGFTAAQNPIGIGIAYPTGQAGTQQAVSQVFGRNLSDQQIADFAGAQVGDVVALSGTGNTLEVTLTGGASGHEGTFEVTRNSRGEITVGNTYVRNTGNRSSGGRDIVSSFDNMKAAGVTYLKASAARSDATHGATLSRFNGYYTWAKLGFTGKIPDSILPAAQARFGSNITRVEQLVKLGSVGLHWWKANGDTWEATFSFKNGSYSMRTLNHYRNAVNRHNG